MSQIAIRPQGEGRLVTAAWAVVAVGMGLVFAILASLGYWYVAVAALLVIPTFVLCHRYPLAGVAVWLAVTPLVVATANPAVRQVYWLIHRGLPIGVLLLVVVSAAIGASTRRLAPLRLPDASMAGFVIVGFTSIAFLSQDPMAQMVLFYDRWVAPMCLYLIVRLLAPTPRDLRWLVPVALGILIVEVPLGIVSLAAPGMLPGEWIILTRATGSFGDPDVLGATMILCGVIVLHAGSVASRPWVRTASLIAFAAAMMMVFLTFSRANWLAGILALGACIWIFRDRIGSLVLVLPLVLVAVLATGALAGPLAFAQERLQSAQARESALARLPVAVASVRMMAAQPVLGFGYGNFDLYSRDYQDKVGNLVYPEKAHASHNLFLSIGAELGLLGLALFLGPMVLWLRASVRAGPRMPQRERRFVAGMWIVIGAFVLVNNFSVMKVTYGLGVWFLALGLIGSTVDRYPAGPGDERDEVRS